MKLKLDFVTNSSSTSFVIADTRDNKQKPITLKLEITLENIIANFEDVYEITTVDELKEYFTDRYWDDWEDDERTLKQFEEQKEAIENGHKLISFAVSNCDGSDLARHIYNEGLGEIDMPDGVLIMSEER